MWGRYPGGGYGGHRAYGGGSGAGGVGKKVEYAVSGRAMCRVCGIKIEKGAMRIGVPGQPRCEVDRGERHKMEEKAGARRGAGGTEAHAQQRGGRFKSIQC